MKNKIALFGFLSSCILFPYVSSAQFDKAKLDSLERLINIGMKNWNIPGLAIAIVKKDSILFMKGYGVKEIGKPEKIDAETIFNVGSVTKQFTGATLSKLAASGRISLDDQVKMYIPELVLKDKLAQEDVRIKDLLCHRTGIPSEGDFATLYTNSQRERVIEKLQFLEPAYGLRNGFSYSNYAFITAGEIFPRVGFTSWDDYLKDSLLVPLEMTRTGTRYKDFLTKRNVATPHHYHNGQVVPIKNYNYDNTAPTGGMTTCIKDMTHWLRMLLSNGVYKGKTILPEEAFRQLFRAHNITTSNASRFFSSNPDIYLRAYALGWRIYDYKKINLIEHNGQVAGMIAQVFLLPEEGIGIVILSNYDTHELERFIMNNTVNLLVNRSMEIPDEKYVNRFLKNTTQWKDEIDELEREAKGLVNPNLNPGLLGKYTNELYGKCEIVNERNIYTIHLLEHENLKGTLKSLNDSEILVTWDDIKFYKSIMRINDDKRRTSFILKVRPSLDTKTYAFEKDGTF